MCVDSVSVQCVCVSHSIHTGACSGESVYIMQIHLAWRNSHEQLDDDVPQSISASFDRSFHITIYMVQRRKLLSTST